MENVSPGKLEVQGSAPLVPAEGQQARVAEVGAQPEVQNAPSVPSTQRGANRSPRGRDTRSAQQARPKPASSSSSADNYVKRCHLCKEMGHIRRNCPKAVSARQHGTRQSRDADAIGKSVQDSIAAERGRADGALEFAKSLTETKQIEINELSAKLKAKEREKRPILKLAHLELIEWGEPRDAMREWLYLALFTVLILPFVLYFGVALPEDHSSSHGVIIAAVLSALPIFVAIYLLFFRKGGDHWSIEDRGVSASLDHLSSTPDLRIEANSHTEVKYEDSQMHKLELRYFNGQSQTTEKRTLNVSLELLAHITTCDAFYADTPDVECMDSLKRSAKRMPNVPINRYASVQGMQIVQDTVLVAFGLHKQYQQSRAGLGFYQAS